MIYHHSLAYKLKMAPFLIDRIQQVHILAQTKDTPEAQTPSQIPRQKEPTGLAGGSSYAPVRLCYQQRPNRRIANLASAFLLLAARKRATRAGKAKLRTQFILFQLFLYVIPNLLFVLAYRIHVVAPAPEFTIAVFELQIAKSFMQHQAAFTLQIPHKSRHAHLGRYLQQHMYMIRAAFRFENCHTFPFTKPA